MDSSAGSRMLLDNLNITCQELQPKHFTLNLHKRKKYHDSKDLFAFTTDIHQHERQN